MERPDLGIGTGDPGCIRVTEPAAKPEARQVHADRGFHDGREAETERLAALARTL